MRSYSVLAANTAWFEFAVLRGEYAQLPPFAVYAFSGEEAVCRPYAFTIELVSKDEKIKAADLLGSEARLTLTDRSGGQRLVHGLIRAMEQLHTAHVHTHYRVLERGRTCSAQWRQLSGVVAPLCLHPGKKNPLPPKRQGMHSSRN